MQKFTVGYLKTTIKYRMFKILRSSTACEIEERVKTNNNLYAINESHYIL